MDDDVVTDCRRRDADVDVDEANQCRANNECANGAMVIHDENSVCINEKTNANKRISTRLVATYAVFRRSAQEDLLSCACATGVKRTV